MNLIPYCFLLVAGLAMRLPDGDNEAMHLPYDYDVKVTTPSLIKEGFKLFKELSDLFNAAAHDVDQGLKIFGIVNRSSTGNNKHLNVSGNHNLKYLVLFDFSFRNYYYMQATKSRMI